MRELTNLFSNQEHNVVLTALEECAKDLGKIEEYAEIRDNTDQMVEHYLLDTPKTSLVAELVKKIYELGYQITPKP